MAVRKSVGGGKKKVAGKTSMPTRTAAASRRLAVAVYPQAGETRRGYKARKKITGKRAR